VGQLTFLTLEASIFDGQRLGLGLHYDVFEDSLSILLYI
jgi:hypothetical protein